MSNPFTSLFEVPTRLDLSLEKHKDFAIVSTAGVIGFLAHCSFFVLFWIFSVDFMTYFNIASILTFAIIYYINRHSVGKYTLLITIASFEIIIHAIFAVLILGWTSNFHLYLFVPMLSTFLVGKANRLSSYIINLSSISVYIFLAVYTNLSLPFESISETGMFTFEILNITNVSSIVIIVTIYYSYIADKSSQELVKINDELKEQSRKVMTFNNELAQQTEELQIQSEQLEHSNKHTTDSIRYALRIQEAVLPTISDLKDLFGNKNVMTFYSPKDIVSGDFYWAKEKNGSKVIAVADCTGHGVPGAMLTMIGESFLNNIILEKGITEPSMILDALQVYFSALFKGGTHNIQDGMDISIAKIDSKNQKLHFAGARNPITYIQNGEMKTIQGDRMSIGNAKIKLKSFDTFTNHQIDISVPTTFYMYTDGYQDQFGGKKDRKFYSKNLRNLFFNIHQKPMSRQRTQLKMTFVKWCDFAKQTDDVTVLGIKIDPNEKPKPKKELASERLFREIMEEEEKKLF